MATRRRKKAEEAERRADAKRAEAQAAKDKAEADRPAGRRGGAGHGADAGTAGAAE